MLLVGMHGIHAASGFWCCPSVYTHLCCGRVPIFVPLIGDVGDNRRANKLRRVASVFGSFICQATMGAGANTVQDWFSAKWAEKLWALTINTPRHSHTIAPDKIHYTNYTLMGLASNLCGEMILKITSSWKTSHQSILCRPCHCICFVHDKEMEKLTVRYLRNAVAQQSPSVTLTGTSPGCDKYVWC